MRNSRLFTVSLLAWLLTGFSACTPDKIVESDDDRYQRAVNDMVKLNKRHDKVILLVAFGSTWQEAYDAYDATVDSYRNNFPDYDVFLSFSSEVCIRNAAAGENIDPRFFYAPPLWLNTFAQDDVRYNEIVVQSLQLIPTRHYKEKVLSCIENFVRNVEGNLDDGPLSHVTLRLGDPLLQDKDEDVPRVAKELDNLYRDLAAGNLVVFMGNGASEENDVYKTNVRFAELEQALQAINPHYFVGTLNVPGNYMTDVYRRMVKAGFDKSNLKVYLHPLLAVNGLHAHDKMAGEDAPIDGDGYTFEDLMALANSDGEIEDCSWRIFFGANGSGFICNDETMILQGLLEMEGIRQIWMAHTRDAL